MDVKNNLSDHFQMANIWYQEKYLLPLRSRSIILCISIIFILLISIIVVQVYKLFPIHLTLEYAVVFDNSSIGRNITIKPANTIKNNQRLSIAHTLIANYVTEREKYDYDRLAQQIVFVKTNSSNEVFNQYYKFISIDNQLSPVLRFQNQVIRTIEIVYINFNSDYSAQVQFRSIAQDANKKILEQILWQADLSFIIDNIEINKPTGSKFNFLIKDYKIRLLNNEIKS